MRIARRQHLHLMAVYDLFLDDFHAHRAELRSTIGSVPNNGVLAALGRSAVRGCFRVVDLLLDDPPEFITVDEQSNDQFVHTLGFRKADGPAHQPLDPRAQVDVLALDALHVLLPDGVLLGVHMALVGPPAVRVISCDAKRLQQSLQAQKDLVLPPSEPIRQDLPRMVIDGMPQPVLMRFLAHVGPHFVEL